MIGIIGIVLLVIAVAALFVIAFSNSDIASYIAIPVCVICFLLGFIMLAVAPVKAREELIRRITEEQIPVYVDGQEVDVENVNLWKYGITIRDGKALLH